MGPQACKVFKAQVRTALPAHTSRVNDKKPARRKMSTGGVPINTYQGMHVTAASPWGKVKQATASNWPRCCLGAAAQPGCKGAIGAVHMWQHAQEALVVQAVLRDATWHC